MKQYKFNNGFIGTYQQAIEKGMFVSSEVKEVPAVQCIYSVK